MILTRTFKIQWNGFEKVIFRFLFSYFIIYIFGIFLGSLWTPVVTWVAKSLLQINYDFKAYGSGSGDNTYQYVLTFTYLIVCIGVTIFWSLLDLKRKSYNDLYYGFLVLLRFVLIYFMIFYGMIKFFHLQMIPPTYSKLIRPLGEMSPMGLAWTFMGYSKGYSMFAGGMEILAGLLLIPRRTVTLGALLTVGVMTQVFIMNLCFDIPVKLFSFHLLLMGLVLFLSDSKRFIKATISRKDINGTPIYPKLKKDEKKIIVGVKIILSVIVFSFIYFGSIARTKKKMSKLNTPFGGVWEVTTFKKNNENIPENYLLKDAWKIVIIDTETSLTVEKINNSKKYFYITIDTINKKISLKKEKDSKDNWFSYHKKDTIMTLNGVLEKDTLEVKMNQKTKKNFLLTNRPFSWINEKPLNR